MRSRLIVFGAAFVIFLAVLSLARMTSSPSMTLLYAGLESGAAGEVVGALEQRGARYEVRGGSIFVDSARRDELRMTLAGDGLPSASSRGYELLDGLSGFGTTSQMFDAAYWRAKEGELARTIVAHPAIQSARVHLASAGSNPFQRDIRQSASVSITARGGEISPKHARALQFLVASAVAGLLPENVSIIDADGSLINGMEEIKAVTTDDRAEAMRIRAERLLEARVGRGNAVVELALQTVTRTESIRERKFDPEGRVAISTDTEERANTSTDEGGDVTVASNLPDGDAAGQSASASENTETRERINYEVSSTEREIVQQPGAIKRMTVAILINGLTAPDAAGAPVFQPRPEEELNSLRDLVASAVGLDDARGDKITIRTMQFEPVEVLGTPVEANLLDRLAIDVLTLLQSAFLAVVALVLGLFVLRPILARSATASPERLTAQPQADGPPDSDLAPISGEIDERDIDETGLSDISATALSDRSLTAMSHMSDETEDPVARLRNMIEHRQDETVEILRSWLEGEEEKA
ncbi:flagellar basal-body MS-ring/collar protein FliF [uncultured Roseovarius sp.]|uniref:flagellar basal-body MS-ring/collar protein FliF n=1 Tax=uncultured Roseovarius sp. TaxID=293344 RepID=UPI00261A4F17|nr:flagellar basal-body MS-ring/collar protein FliF [uncultured Roseovarius sp.]